MQPILSYNAVEHGGLSEHSFVPLLEMGWGKESVSSTSMATHWGLEGKVTFGFSMIG